MSNGDASVATHVLDLTSKRRGLARKIVTLVDGLDWQQIKEADCDVVDIEFQTRESLDAAMDLLMKLAAHDDRLALRAQEKLLVIFKRLSGLQVVAEPDAGIGGTAATAGARSEAETVLEQIKSVEVEKVLQVPLTSQPMEFYLGWKQVTRLLQTLETLQSQGIRFAPVRGGQQVPTALPVVVPEAGVELLAPALPRPPLGEAIPVTLGANPISGDPQVPADLPLPPINFGRAVLGPVSELWLQVPLELVVARPMLRLCYRIASINTGIKELLVKPDENIAARLLLQLFNECRPVQYQVPAGDMTGPYASVVQHQIKKSIPLLRELVTSVAGDSGRTEQPTHSEATAVVSTKVPHAVHPVADSAEATAGLRDPANERPVEPNTKIRVTGQASSVEIVINDDIAVLVGNRSVRGVAHRAALWIASQIEDGATSIDIKIWDFVQEVYGKATNAKYVNNTWLRNRDALEKIGSVAESVGQNGTLQGQAGESVTRGARWRRELWGSKAVATARLPAHGVWGAIDLELGRVVMLRQQRLTRMRHHSDPQILPWRQKIKMNAESTSGGNWIVSNFRLQFSPKATKAAIKERLEKRSPRPRRRRQ